MNDKLKNILEWLYCIIMAVVLALIFRYYIGTPTMVQNKSMYPTLIQEQRLWLNRWGRTTKKLPERGEIITFEAPSNFFPSYDEVSKANPIAKYEKEPQGILNKFTYYVLEIGKDSYIKRTIGLPGEHIQIKDSKIYINGKELEEDYLQPNVTTEGKKYNDFIVPENCVFAMGDNREHSTDCRDFGCIPLEKIESKVWIRIWPLNLWGKVK